MLFFPESKIRLGIVAALAAVLCQGALGQDTQSKDTPAPVRESRGMPPRVSPAEYQAHAQAGKVIIAAEFTRHSVATPEATFSAEDYIVVEVAFFGPPDARLKLSHEDFALRVNDKKAPLASQPFGLVLRSLKDPEWSPPESAASKSKTSIGDGGGGGGQGDPPPAPVHMPFELQRAMELKVQKAAMLEGDRALPQAGLIFFSYRGKPEGIHSLDLIYTGPAGKTVLALHP
jgi:hypothetical protein